MSDSFNNGIYIYIIISLILSVIIFSDNRFSLKRKLILLIIILSFLFFSIIIDKSPILIIKDLFWYSLVLNISFIIHVLILDRIFYWAVEKEKFLLAILISRFSFICSLWGIIYLFKFMVEKIIWFIDPIQLYYYTINKEDKNLYLYKYAVWMNKILKNKILDFFIKFVRFINFIVNIISIILIHFSLVFHNYINFIFGNIKNKTLIEWLNFLIYWLLLLLLSIIIGIPRLYIIWILQGFIELFKIFTYWYGPEDKRIGYIELENKKEKLNFIIQNLNIYMLINCCYEKKYINLDLLTKQIYNNLFIFDLIKFIFDKYNKGLYASLWELEENEETRKIYNDNMILSITKIKPLLDILYGYVDMIYILNEKLNFFSNEIEKNSINKKKKEILLELLKFNKFDDINKVFLKKYIKD